MSDASKLGEILVRGGFVRDYDVDNALRHQPRLAKPLGDILRRRGLLNREEQRLALTLQARLRELQQTAREFFRMVAPAPLLRRRCGLQLGQLLVSTGQISQPQLQQALAAQRRSKRHLGEELVEQGFISQQALNDKLRVQKRLWAAAMGTALAMQAAPGLAAGPGNHAAATAPGFHAEEEPAALVFPELRHCQSTQLQQQLEREVAGLGLTTAVKKQQLALALVDITQPDAPQMATLNGDQMMYAASLPKIGILLGAMQKVAEGELDYDQQTQATLTKMIRSSSNAAATAVYEQVGPDYLADTLVRYGLYDPEHNGGLWVGKPYSKGPAWKRDPLHGISHGATPIQVARFLYLMETGQLVSTELSAAIKRTMGKPAIAHKFVKGLRQAAPESRIFRKSGTWRNYHSDAALVERDGRRYIAVALAQSAQGSRWLSDLIVSMDGIIHQPAARSSIDLASAQ